jgi:K319L-like, PKD domain
MLDGSASNDADGNITNYKWSAISGYPWVSVPDIQNTNAKQTEVGNLRSGIYRFELKVTDNKGAYSVDTVTVQVEDRVYPSHPVGFYPWVYSGFSWNPTATTLKVVGPVPEWTFADFPEDNDGSKWIVQLEQQATNTAISLPYVRYNNIATTNGSIFYSIWDLVAISPGENPTGSIYIFANPAQTSGIDFIKPVDVIVYLKL